MLYSDNNLPINKSLLKNFSDESNSFKSYFTALKKIISDGELTEEVWLGTEFIDSTETPIQFKLVATKDKKEFIPED